MVLNYASFFFFSLSFFFYADVAVVVVVLRTCRVSLIHILRATTSIFAIIKSNTYFFSYLNIQMAS